MKHSYTCLHVILSLVTLLSTSVHAHAVYESFQNTVANEVEDLDIDSVLTSLCPPLNTVKVEGPSTSERQSANQISIPVTRGSSHIPKAFEIDKTKEVGEIHYTSSTTKTGAKTYDVPIEIYTGMNGFQPAIALSYNSQNGNSITGKGWSLSGISFIRRTVKNLYYDFESDGVRMNGNDAFILDGVRLIKIDDSDKSCIIYESEYGHIKVKGYSSGDIQTYFEVFYPNGEKGIFGYKNSNEQEIEYPLTIMTDLDGNNIEYIYDHVESHYRISSISYNGCSVEFSYTDRNDPMLMYCGGKKIYESSLLKGITAKHGLFPVGSYELSYTYISGTALISDITYSFGSKSFNPLRFLYDDDAVIADGFESSSTILNESYNMDSKYLKSIRGRIDPDLCEEGFLVYPNRIPYWRHTKDGAKYDEYVNLYPEDAKIFAYSDLRGDFEMSIPPLSTGKGFIDIICASLEGSMEESVVKINNYVSGNKDIIEFSVYKMSLGMPLVKAYTRTYEWDLAHKDRSGNLSVYPKFFHAGDFNGDGRTEILVISPQEQFGPGTGITICQVFDLEADKSLYKGCPFNFVYQFSGEHKTGFEYELLQSDRLIPIDFDGDGKTDLCHINAYGTDIYVFECIESHLTVSKRSTETKLAKGWNLVIRDFFVTDLNGDGLMDILFSCDKDGSFHNWTVFNSTGTGTFERNDFYGPTFPSKGNGGFLLQDINGDGIQDLIRYDEKGFSTFIAKDNRYGADPTTTVQTENALLIPTNIHSTNRPIQLVGITAGTATKYTYYDNNRTSTLLRGMVNSLGVVEINDYGVLNEAGTWTDLYSRGYGSQYPFVDILEPFTVLSSSEVYLNGKINDRHEFQYSEGVFHKQGLGFCGFKTILKSTRRGLVELHTYDPYNYTILKSISGSQFEASYAYDVKVQPNRVRSITPTSKTEKDLLRGYSSTTSFVCDAYGNPTKETVVYSDGTNIVQTNSCVSNPTVGDGYHIGWKSGYEKKITRNGSIYTEKLSSPSYRNRRPLQQVFSINGYTVQSTTYTYDTQGNTTSETIKPYQSAVGKTTKYTYDGKGRKVTETDYLGRKQSYTYNVAGQLKSILDYRGGRTTFTYDLYDREATVSYPDSTVKNYQYSWSQNTSTDLYSIIESRDGEPCITTYYDALNREVKSSEQGLGGDIKSTERRYDSYGNLWMVSEPFTGTSPSLWNVYEYDWHGRITVENGASGNSVKYTYGKNPHFVKTNDGNITVTRKYDPFGNLISITDPSGTITYEVAPDGQLASITAHDDIKTSVKYDSYRRRIGLLDPSLGNQSCKYDPAGNVVSSTNANNELTSYEYDSFQRLKKITGKDFTSTYYYNIYGDIDSVCNSNGTSKKYSYDNTGRVVRCTETGMDGMWLRKDFTYSKGLLTAIKYTSRFGTITTERYFYSNGRLQEVILSNGTTIFKVEKENEFGHPTEIKTGGITRKYEYTSQGFPSKRSAYSSAGTYQNVSYGFDSKIGNLLWRSDNARNQKETFQYDQFQRLTGYGGCTATYDNRGNICGKSDIGTFGYSNASKPYALTEATLASESIPTFTQDIEYAFFSRPATISEDDHSYAFDYNDEGDRVKMTESSGGKTISVHHYLGGCYEVKRTPQSPYTIESLYLLGDYYSSPAVIQKLSFYTEKIDSVRPPVVADSLRINNFLADNPSSLGGSAITVPGQMPKSYIYYILRDYLGSITHIVHSDGTLKQELSYDAWGRLRDPKTWDCYADGEEPELFIGRGYTGHEHLVKAGLINMNARLYDPALGRFLSPDPYVQIPDWSQNLNRYTYAMNNPLVYIDEDGQFFWFAVGAAAVIGGTFNVLNNWDAITSAGGWNGVWQGTKYFMVGAAAGGVSAAVGIGAAVGFGSMLGVTATGLAAASSSLTSSLVMKTTEGAVNGFMVGSMNALIQGEDWTSALRRGVQDAAIDGVFSAATAGLQSMIPKARNYHVYYGKDANGDIRYVGITRQEPKVRFGQHKSSLEKDKKTPTLRSTLDFDVADKNKMYTWREARVWEQESINEFGLMKNGGQLYNKRNEIRRWLWDIYGVKY